MRIKKYTGGFSLVELMCVIAIIGILATFAMTQYQSFKIKAMQSEAKINLTHMEKLQITHKSQVGWMSTVPFTNGSGDINTRCNMPNAIGFHISNCPQVRYTYIFAMSYGYGASSGGTVDVCTVLGFPVTTIGFCDFPTEENKLKPGCTQRDIFYKLWDSVTDDFRLERHVDVAKLC
jgi:prepilin-type N-terminal cleavage/methylation domain-containing protein